MVVSARDPTIGLCSTLTDSREIVEALEELLTQSIHLRDLYKRACWQASAVQDHGLRQLFDAHYKEQLRLVDLLIDRIRTLGGDGTVFAGDFLQGTQFPHHPRGRSAPTRLLRELLDAHEWVLTAALPTGSNHGQSERGYARDFALGQVVLANELQSSVVREQLMGCETKETVRQMHASASHGYE
jgi:starvation-inducible DNA-binding protein